MINQSQVYQSICNKRPLVYQIGANYYVLGYKTCRKCRDKEITLFQQLNNALEEETGAIDKTVLNKNDVKKSISLFNKIQLCCDDTSTENDDNLFRFFDKLNQPELNQISTQLEKYLELYNWIDGNFVR